MRVSRATSVSGHTLLFIPPRHARRSLESARTHTTSEASCCIVALSNLSKSSCVTTPPWIFSRDIVTLAKYALLGDKSTVVEKKKPPSVHSSQADDNPSLIDCERSVYIRRRIIRQIDTAFISGTGQSRPELILFFFFIREIFHGHNFEAKNCPRWRIEDQLYPTSRDTAGAICRPWGFRRLGSR